ncbi:MAG: hypothetical protein M3Q00_02480, partial [Pseudomonadota bacterium]|nr:hypothetical protein [Pseudomonadota bacterium]
MGFPLVVRALILGLMFSTYTALSADDPTNATTPKAVYEPAAPTPATEPEKTTDDGAVLEAVTPPMPEADTPSVPEAVTPSVPEAVTPPMPEAVT